MKLKDIPRGGVPYISTTDLIVFKMNSCGLRAQPAKKRVDAADAETLLEQETRKSPLKLNSTQKGLVEPSIQDVVAHGSRDESWWRAHLGLTVKK
jgi:hypothetical protein